MIYLGFLSLIIGMIGTVFIFFFSTKLIALILAFIALLLGLLGIYFKSKNKESKLLEIMGTILATITIIGYVILLIL